MLSAKNVLKEMIPVWSVEVKTAKGHQGCVDQSGERKGPQDFRNC